MKPITFLTCVLFLTSSYTTHVNAVPHLAPSATMDCGNGLFCAAEQTCMSNATGAGLIYACSPIQNAVRCMDARFSCPPSFMCYDNSTCAPGAQGVDGAEGADIVDAVVNIDAHHVAEYRDFGSGMKPTGFSICGVITGTFRLPNFCSCKDARFGGELSCVIGIQTYITIGASAWVLPCASPANVGYRAWASLLGVGKSIGNTWTAEFMIRRPIPGASFEMGIANVGANAELSGDIREFVISTKIAIGVCAQVGIGPFSKEICNPSALSWLPVTVLNGPRHDFSRLC